MKTIKEWFGLCNHKWKTLKMEAIDKIRLSDGASRYVGDIYTMQCEKCGKVKGFKIMI